VVAQLDDPGDIEHVVEAAVPGPRQPVAQMLAAGGVDRGVPVQDAKWFRSGNRAMSPASARIRAAPAGPMPWMSIKCEPVARTAFLSSAFMLSLGSKRCRSSSSSAAIRRRVFPPDRGDARWLAAPDTGARIPSWLAVGPAEPDETAAPPLFSAWITGSYERTAWKQELHDQLVQADATPVRPGPAGVRDDDRARAQLDRPLETLIDAFGPVLGEDPLLPFHPRDDRILCLGLHHRITGGIGHDMIIDAWRTNQ
jgi:hypothetical protein